MLALPSNYGGRCDEKEEARHGDEEKNSSGWSNAHVVGRTVTGQDRNREGQDHNREGQDRNREGRGVTLSWPKIGLCRNTDDHRQISTES